MYFSRFAHKQHSSLISGTATKTTAQLIVGWWMQAIHCGKKRSIKRARYTNMASRCLCVWVCMCVNASPFGLEHHDTKKKSNTNQIFVGGVRFIRVITAREWNTDPALLSTTNPPGGKQMVQEKPSFWESTHWVCIRDGLQAPIGPFGSYLDWPVCGNVQLWYWRIISDYGISAHRVVLGSGISKGSFQNQSRITDFFAPTIIDQMKAHQAL